MPTETRAGYVLWLAGALSLLSFESTGAFAIAIGGALAALGLLAMRGLRWPVICGALWCSANAAFGWFRWFRSDARPLADTVALLGASFIALLLVRWALRPTKPIRG